MAGDAVEEGAEHLGGAQAHVLVGLVDEELVEGELVGGDGGEAAGFGFGGGGQLVGGVGLADESDAVGGGGVDGAAGEQVLLCVFDKLWPLVLMLRAWFACSCPWSFLSSPELIVILALDRICPR